jgi:hypothetical protein
MMYYGLLNQRLHWRDEAAEKESHHNNTPVIISRSPSEFSMR